MTTPVDRSIIQIEVSNYGPIEKAKIDLRPLTVFLGPSNTGKSYLAILVYALHRFFNGAAFFGTDIGDLRSVRHFPVRVDVPRFVHGENDPRRDVKVLGDWIEQLFASQRVDSHLQVLPAEVADLVRPYLEPDTEWNETLLHELARCFGTETTDWIIRHGSLVQSTLGTNIALKVLDGSQHVPTVQLEYDFDLQNATPRGTHSVHDEALLQVDPSNALPLMRNYRALRRRRGWELEADDLIQSFRSALIEGVAECVGSTMVSPLSSRAHYLPADRTGVMHAHQVVVASMILGARATGFGHNIQIPNLSGVLRDFLVQLLSLSTPQSRQRTTSSPDLGSLIERRMLLGSIEVDQSDANYPVFSYLPVNWEDKLPLMNSSSMVSELAPVVLYLRNIVEPGDVLIIEEPESNLHPAMQVELIRQIARVVNSGVRVILTTHSEWVLEELSNLVRLSDLNEEKKSQFPEAPSALDRLDVGVWLFEYGSQPKGSFVREVLFDSDEGGFIPGYDQVARLTYNQWAKISNLIEGGESL